MTAGSKRRPAETSERRAQVEPEVRLSVHTWAKGSARGEGPQQQRSAVVVQAPRKWVPCEDCGSARPAHMRGRHGAMPVTGGTLAAVGAAWQVCRHGVPFWQGCRAQAVEPPCCAFREEVP